MKHKLTLNKKTIANLNAFINGEIDREGLRKIYAGSPGLTIYLGCNDETKHTRASCCIPACFPTYTCEKQAGG